MAKKKANVKGDALVYVVLDKSGSMAAIRDATIEGVDRFIAETAKANADAQFHLSMFDTDVRKVNNGEAIGSVETIRGTYNPGGSTALLDGVGRAVKEIEDLPSIPSKVVIVIMTDGQENASHEYTREAVKAKVSQHEREDKWQFLFLGANLDAFAEAGAIGMAAAASSSATWQPTMRGTAAAYLATASSTADYLTGSAGSAVLTQDSYDAVYASLGGDDETTPDATPTRTSTVDVTPTKPSRRRPK